MKVRTFYVASAGVCRSLALGGALLGFACEARDLSEWLNTGRCDSRDRCGSGFECNTDTRECVPKGTLGGAPGQGGSDSGGAGDGTVSTSAGAGGAQGPDAGLPLGNAGSAGVSAGGQLGTAGVRATANAGQGCTTSDCACDGRTRCGEVCVDTSSDLANCGACGRACPTKNFSCIIGQCLCTKDNACGAGTKGLCVGGYCECDSVRCAAGERCLSDGSCDEHS